MQTLKSALHETDYDERLFSFDVFVQRIMLNNMTGIGKGCGSGGGGGNDGGGGGKDTFYNLMQSTSSAMAAPRGLVLGFRLWEFPLLYIQPSQTAYFADYEDSGRSSRAPRNIAFQSGKSCIFKMALDILQMNLQTNPLYVYLFDFQHQTLGYGDTEGMRLPVLVASKSIYLGKLSPPEDQSSHSTIHGTFALRSKSGHEVGIIDIDLRIKALDPTYGMATRSFGAETLDHFTASNRSSIPSGTSRFVDLRQSHPLLVSTADFRTGYPPNTTVGLAGIPELANTFKNQRRELQDTENQLRNALFDVTKQIQRISLEVADMKQKKSTKIKRKKKRWVDTSVRSPGGVFDPNRASITLGQWTTRRRRLPNNKIKTVRTRMRETVTLVKPKKKSTWKSNQSTQREVGVGTEEFDFNNYGLGSDEETTTLGHRGVKRVTLSTKDRMGEKSSTGPKLRYSVRHIKPTIVDKSIDDRLFGKQSRKLKSMMRESVQLLEKSSARDSDDQDSSSSSESDIDESRLSAEEKKLLQHHRDLLERLNVNYRELKDKIRKRMSYKQQDSAYSSSSPSSSSSSSSSSTNREPNDRDRHRNQSLQSCREKQQDTRTSQEKEHDDEEFFSEEFEVMTPEDHGNRHSVDDDKNNQDGDFLEEEVLGHVESDTDDF